MPREQLEDKIGSDFANRYQDQLDHDRTRQKIICVFDDRIKTVDFADQVKKYAAEEIDRRIFRSFQYWLTVILTAGITAAIGFVVSQVSQK